MGTWVQLDYLDQVVRKGMVDLRERVDSVEQMVRLGLEAQPVRLALADHSDQPDR